jgi:hypothetical protein
MAIDRRIGDPCRTLVIPSFQRVVYAGKEYEAGFVVGADGSAEA